MTKQAPPSALNIDDACHRIDPAFLDSALLTSHSLGFELLAKDETDNPIRSFKGRGTSYLLARQAGATDPIVTASAGNFGQGLAFSAARYGRSLTVFASVNASALKIEAMRRLGATVVLESEDFDGAKEAGRAYAARLGLPFIEDGADAAIAEGAGTMAAELTDAVGAVDIVYVSLGNGALAAGVGCWFKARFPHSRVVAVAAAGAPCMALSFAESRPIETAEANTIADGIAVRIPVPLAVEWLRDTVDEVVLVSDEQILDAMRFAHAEWGRIVEPAGAAGLAAAMANRASLAGKRVATFLCGGNLTDTQIRDWLPSADI